MVDPSDKRPSFPGLSKDPKAVRQRVEALERVMERLVVVPGIKRPIGLDVILDVIPFVGSTAAAAIGAYLAWEARNIGMSKWHLTRMAGNIGIDWVLGLIPFLGVVPDLLFQSNSRNVRIIKRHLDRLHPEGATVDSTPPGTWNQGLVLGLMSAIALAAGFIMWGSGRSGSELIGFVLARALAITLFPGLLLLGVEPEDRSRLRGYDLPLAVFAFILLGVVFFRYL
jgi:Domain of unknown function (DUF4112)